MSAIDTFWSFQAEYWTNILFAAVFGVLIVLMVWYFDRKDNKKKVSV